MAHLSRAVTAQRGFGARAETMLGGAGHHNFRSHLRRDEVVEGPQLAPSVHRIIRRKAREAKERVRKRRQQEEAKRVSRLEEEKKGARGSVKPSLRVFVKGAMKEGPGTPPPISPVGYLRSMPSWLPTSPTGVSSTWGSLWSPRTQSAGSGQGQEQGGAATPTGKRNVRRVLLTWAKGGKGGSAEALMSQLAQRQRRDDPVVRSRKSCMAYPNTLFKIYWDALVALLVLYTCVMVPYRIGFGEEPKGFMASFELSINFVFLADVLITFRTPFFDAKGMLVTGDWAIVSHYLRHGFVIDFVSSFPFDLVTKGGALSRSAMLLRVLKLTRLLRLFRVMKLSRILGENQDRVYLKHNLTTVLRVSATLLTLAHFLGCVWHGVTLTVPFGGFDWLLKLQDIRGALGDAQIYLTSLYFAFTTITTVGYGDILAVNHLERLVAILVMLVGGIVFGFVVGSVTSVIQNYDPSATLTRERLSLVKCYLRDRRVPRLLQERVVAYFEACFERCSVFDNSVLVHALPGPLAMQLNFVHYDRIIRSISFLHMHRASFANSIVRALRPLRLGRTEVLFTEGDLGAAMYFITHGTLRTFVTLSKAGGGGEDEDVRVPLFETLGIGALAGEVALLLNMPQPVTAIAADECEMFWVARQDLLVALSSAVDVDNELVVIASNNLRRIARFREAKRLEFWGPDVLETVPTSPLGKSGNSGSKRVTVSMGRPTMAGLLSIMVSGGRANLLDDDELMGPDEGVGAGAGAEQAERHEADKADGLMANLQRAEEQEPPDDSFYDSRLVSDPAYLLTKKGIVHPEARLKIAWDIFIYALSLYSVLSVTFRVGFGVDSATSRTVDFFINFMFIADIFLTFNTAEPLPLEKALVTKKRVIAMRYLRSWFAIDVLTAIPFELLDESATGFMSNRVLRMLRMIRLVRVTRISKLVNKLEAYEDVLFLFNPSLIRMVRIVILLVFVAHIDACVWYYAGSLSGESWITKYCPGPCLPEMGLKSRYLASLYWSITTMMTVGYGDITPALNSTAEKVVAIVTQIIGAVTISYLIGTMLNLLINFNPGERRRRNESSLLHEYLRSLKLKARGGDGVQQVLRAVSQNFLFFLDSKSPFPEDDILLSLPPPLRQPISTFLLHRALPRLPLLCRLEAQFPGVLAELHPLLRPGRYRKGDVVYTPDLAAREMLLLHVGKLEVVEEGRVVDRVNAGQVFGEAFLALPEDVSAYLTCTVVAVSEVRVFHIARNEFMLFADVYPEVVDYFLTLVDQERAYKHLWSPQRLPDLVSPEEPVSPLAVRTGPSRLRRGNSERPDGAQEGEAGTPLAGPASPHGDMLAGPRGRLAQEALATRAVEASLESSLAQQGDQRAVVGSTLATIFAGKRLRGSSPPPSSPVRSLVPGSIVLPDPRTASADAAPTATPVQGAGGDGGEPRQG